MTNKPTNKLTIVHTNSVIELYYTLYPFLLGIPSNEIKFVHFNSNKYNSVTGKNVLFIRIFKNRFNDIDFIQKTIVDLKNRFENIYYLDDSAGADSTHFEFISDLDGYFKAKILNDYSYFKQETYGRQVFSDYYHKVFGVDDKVISVRKPIHNSKELKKLHLAFNLGYGMYPKPSPKSIKRATGYLFARINNFQLMKPLFKLAHENIIGKLSESIDYKKKNLLVSSRFRFESYPNSIGYQRKLFNDIINGNENFTTGIISPTNYIQELKKVLITLSPFGYGEVCVRDFEAILNGSLLLKPDMSHISTWPDIYIPNETYIPLKWDGSDLLDKVDNILSNPKKFIPIIKNSRIVYQESLQNIERYFQTKIGAFFKL